MDEKAEGMLPHGIGETEVYRLSFRIRRIYFDLIKNGLKDNEIRAAKPFWDVRASRAHEVLRRGGSVKAVLVCGKDRLIKEVKEVSWYETSVGALNRKPSEQGMKDIGMGPVWKFHFVMPEQGGLPNPVRQHTGQRKEEEMK